MVQLVATLPPLELGIGGQERKKENRKKGERKKEKGKRKKKEREGERKNLADFLSQLIFLHLSSRPCLKTGGDRGGEGTGGRGSVRVGGGVVVDFTGFKWFKLLGFFFLRGKGE